MPLALSMWSKWLQKEIYMESPWHDLNILHVYSTLPLDQNLLKLLPIVLIFRYNEKLNLGYQIHVLSMRSKWLQKQIYMEPPWRDLNILHVYSTLPLDQNLLKLLHVPIVLIFRYNEKINLGYQIHVYVLIKGGNAL